MFNPSKLMRSVKALVLSCFTLLLKAQNNTTVSTPILSELKAERLPIINTWEQFVISGNGSSLVIPNGYDIYVYNLSNFKERCHIKPPYVGTYNFGCAINHDGGKLFVASGLRVLEYDSNSGMLLHQSKEICLDRLIALSPDEQFLASAARESGREVSLEDQSLREGDRVSLWKVDSLELIRTFVPVRNFLGGLTFSPNGQNLLRIGHEGMQIWSVASGELIHKNKTSMNGNPVWLFDTNRVFGSGQVTAPAEILDVSSGNPNPSPQDSGASGNWCSAISPNQRMMVSGLVNGRNAYGYQFIYVWDIKSGRLKYRIRCGNDGCTALGFSPDGKWLYASVPHSKYGFIRWDLSKSKALSASSLYTHP